MKRNSPQIDSAGLHDRLRLLGIIYHAKVYHKTGSFVLLLHFLREGMGKPTDSCIGIGFFSLRYKKLHDDLKFWF